LGETALAPRAGRMKARRPFLTRYCSGACGFGTLWRWRGSRRPDEKGPAR